MAKLSQFLEGHPKPAFSEKKQRGDQEKFFKNHPNSSPCLKCPKVLWRKLNYTLIKMLLKCKNWRRFWRKKHQKFANGQVIGIFARSPKTRIFWKSAKGGGGDQGKFLKNRPKGGPRWKGPKALWRKWHYPLISMHLKCKNWKRFWRKQRL